MNKFEINEDLFLKVLTGQTDSSNIQEFNHWLQTDEKNKAQFEEYKLLWEKLGNVSKVKEPIKEIEWEKIESKINLANSFKPFDNEVYYKSKSKIGGLKFFLRIAAMVAFIFISIFIYQKLSTKHVKSVTSQSEEIFQTLKTKKGEKANIKLSDLSEVQLNSASILKYPESFNNKYRTVELEGEAYFRVTSDKTKPFRVIVNSQIIEVVGTEFNIYNRNNNCRVVVTKGKINAFQKNNKSAVAVSQGQMIQLNNKNEFTSPININVDDYLGWRTNKLIFKDTRLEDVMKEIENYFNVSVEFKNNKTKKKLLSGSFKINTLEEIVTAISISMNVDISKKENTLIISENY